MSNSKMTIVASDISHSKFINFIPQLLKYWFNKKSYMCLCTVEQIKDVHKKEQTGMCASILNLKQIRIYVLISFISEVRHFFSYLKLL